MWGLNLGKESALPSVLSLGTQIFTLESWLHFMCCSLPLPLGAFLDMEQSDLRRVLPLFRRGTLYQPVSPGCLELIFAFHNDRESKGNNKMSRKTKFPWSLRLVLPLLFRMTTNSQGQSKSTMGRVLALHVVKPSSIPSIL